MKMSLAYDGIRYPQVTSSSLVSRNNCWPYQCATVPLETFTYRIAHSWDFGSFEPIYALYATYAKEHCVNGSQSTDTNLSYETSAE
jgi:hypothetical protein